MRGFIASLFLLTCLRAEGWDGGRDYLSIHDKISLEKEAVSNILSKCEKAHFFIPEIEKIVHFIENDLSSFIDRSEFYVYRSRSGLSSDVEYDPATGFVFIHSRNLCSEKKHKKIISKAVQYDRKHPKIVAVAVAKEGWGIEKEIEVLKQLQDIDCSLELIGTPFHMQGNQFIQEMIVPFYEGKDFLKKDEMRFCLKEKISLAVDLMEVLTKVHEKGIIHGDVHRGNLLLKANKKVKEEGVRYHIVLIDWESSCNVCGFSHEKRKDLYWAACSLYSFVDREKWRRSLYEKGDLFQQIYQSPFEEKDSHELILGEITKEITKRKKELDRKNKNKSMTREEEFEWIILRMMHPTYGGKEDAAYWHNEYKTLLYKKNLK